MNIAWHIVLNEWKPVSDYDYYFPRLLTLSVQMASCPKLLVVACLSHPPQLESP